MAGEESKFGVAPEETEDLIREIAKLPSIAVKGLMTIAPYVENPEDNRGYFSSLKKLCVDIKNKNIDNVSMDILSMGMTGIMKWRSRKVPPWSVSGQAFSVKETILYKNRDRWRLEYECNR